MKNNMFIDTHAHLFFQNFENDIDEVLENALAAGVKKIIVPGTSIKTSKQSIQLAEKYEFIYSTVGVHPHDTAEWQSTIVNELEELTKHPKVVAIGEIGLDYYYDFSPKEKQIVAFRDQIELALQKDLPIIIHNRDSNEDLMNIIEEYDGRGLRGQFHCFAGSVNDARTLVEKGFYISFPGNVTFVKADNLRNVLRSIDIENLLLETDSPFMTPVPHRGKRNEPAYIPLIATTIAKVHNVTVEDVARTTTANVYKLFGVGNKSEKI
jgi:TatD DNase family protein